MKQIEAGLFSLHNDFKKEEVKQGVPLKRDVVMKPAV
jgi:hypothetical protein